MECQARDSKKISKVVDATKRKRTRKKHEAIDDWQSVASDGTNDRRGTNGRHLSTKGSYHECARTPNANRAEELHGKSVKQRHSDQSVHNSHQDDVHRSRSGRRHRREPRDEISLALRAGLVSTPRSTSPHQNCESGIGAAPHDDISFMEGLHEEAMKQERRKHRQSRRHDESSPRERRHRRHREDLGRENHSRKEEKSSIDQAVLLETLIKLCSQMQTDPARIPRKHSNKSLQCEESQHRLRDCQERSRELYKHNISPTRTASNDHCRGQVQKRDRTVVDDGIQTEHDAYEKSRHASRLNMNDIDNGRVRYTHRVRPTRYHIDVPVRDSYDEYERKVGKNDEDRLLGQRMSRSFDVPREIDRNYRKNGLTDGVKNRSFDSGVCRDKMYEEYRYKYKDYYDNRDYPTDYNKENKIYRSQKVDLDRASIFSTDDFRNRGKCMERERDAGLSVADVDDESTASCKSNYLRAVKQEITEQREAMDKMMKLWKELMRAFKGPSRTREPTKSVVEKTAGVRESAAAQLQLWRECMRRYETVARDVGDTDARLMEELNKQRAEMAEMSAMFQECLQRYKDMSDDFHTLKHQIQSESPVRLPTAPSPYLPPCTEGDGTMPAHYRLPYPPHVTGVPPPMGGYPLRSQLSAPPPTPLPCCWAEGLQVQHRRVSPDSRAGRDRHRERGESRYKEKSKPSGSKSEHRHRKR